MLHPGGEEERHLLAIFFKQWEWNDASGVCDIRLCVLWYVFLYLCLLYNVNAYMFVFTYTPVCHFHAIEHAYQCCHFCTNVFMCVHGDLCMCVCVAALFLVYEPPVAAAAAALVHWPACLVAAQINGKIIKREAKSMEMCIIKTNRITYSTWHQFTLWAPPAKFKATLFSLERG